MTSSVEFQIPVTDPTDTRFFETSTASLPNGTVAVTWVNYESMNGTTVRSIGVRVIGSDGQPITTELVDAGLPGNERFPEVVAIDDTHFAVIYCNTAGYDVQGRIYTVTGTSLSAGPVISLTDPAFSGENGYSIGVSSLPDGKIIVAWTQSSPDYISARVMARTFDANLNPLSAEIQISQTATPSPYRVRVDTDGNKVVVGWSQNQADTKVHALATAFEVGADGSIPGTGHTDVDVSVNGNVHSITTLANGDVLVVYNGGPISGGTLDDGDRLFGKIYEPGLTGNPTSFLINETVVETGTGIAEVVAFKNGGFAVYWSQLLSGNQATGMEIYTRVYDKNYQAVTGQVQVNSPNASVDNMVEAVVDADGNVTLVWERDISGGTPSTLIVGTTLADQDPNGRLPKLAGDYTVEVKEGLSVVLTTADFTVANAIKVPEDSVYTVSGLVHGTVLVNGVAATSFTQAQLAVGAVLFQHDGSETLTGSFRITSDFSTDPSVNGATISVNVEPANDAPIVSAPSSISLTEDTPKALTGISFSDVDAGSNFVTVTLSVPAGALVASSGFEVTVGGTASTMTLVGTIAAINAFIAGGGVSYIPAANATATSILTVSINDGGNAGSGGPLTDTRTVDLNVAPVNDAPTAAADDLPAVDEGSGVIVIEFADLLDNDVAGPANEAGQQLEIVAVSNPTGGTVRIVDGHIEFTPAANFYGLASFTYSIRDNGTTNGVSDPKVSTGTVTLNVDARADTPTVASVTTREGSQSGIIVISRNAADGGEVTHFKITGITGGTLYLSDGVTVVANGSFITYAQAAAGLKFTPSPNFFGAANFQVQASTSASDAGLGGSPATAIVTVTPVNDAPIAMDELRDVAEDGSYAFWATDFGFADPLDGGANNLAAIYVDTLPAKGTLTFDGVALTGPMRVAAADIGKLVYTPAPDESGSFYANFKFRLQDDGGIANGGVDTSAQYTMTMNVLPENDAPVVTTPAAGISLLEDTSGALTGISFSDPDAGSGMVTVTLAADGTFHAVSDGGVTAATVTGGLTLTGTIADINAYIAGGTLSFRALPDVTGQLNLHVTINDGGNTGAGGAQTSSADITLNILPVNDAPTASDGRVTIKEDGTYSFKASNFGFADDDGNSFAAIYIESLPASGHLTFNGQPLLSPGVTIAFADIGQLAFVPDSGGNGLDYASFGFRVKDNGGTANGGLDTSDLHRIDIDVISVIDGVAVDRTETDNGDGTFSQAVVIPVVTAGRTETAGDTRYADIPLVSAGGSTLLAVQVGVGIGLTAAGFAAPRPVGASLADLIREIQARTAAGSADQAALTGGGSGFLAGLSASGPVLVQSIVATQSGPTSGVPLVISGSTGSGAPATALVIDARGLAAGTTIALQNVDFAAIIGSVRVTGGAGSQVVFGDSASQHIVLGADDDTLHGGGGHDYVGSKGGNDWLYGDAGNDTVSGGSGNDRLFGGTGHDRLLGGTGHDRLDGGSGNDRLYGDSGNDTLLGGAGQDALWGGTGADRLEGGSGNDILKGDSGNDRLVGGLGRDKLWGGSGNDVFVFNSVAESKVGSQRDIIYDFQSGRDRIDLRGIDANEKLKGNQAFSWIGAKVPFLHPHEAASLFMKAGFTGRAGELRYDKGILMGDTDGDRRADFEIRVVGKFAVGDVIL